MTESAARPPEALPTPRAAKAPYLLIALAVLALDQWTKWLLSLIHI